MEKIKNYIKNGKGLGFLFLLAASVLMTMCIMFALKQVYSQFRPQIMLAADEILPIDVRDGKIISPQDTYKKVDINLGEYNGKTEIFPVVLDTKSETSAMPKAEIGLFIMQDVVYWVMQDEVRRVQLRDGELNKNLLEEKLDSFLGISSLFISIMMIFLIFVFSLIKSLVLVLFGGLILKVKHLDKWLSFEAQMRLAAVVVAMIETCSFVLSLLGLPIMWFYQLLIEMLLVGWYIVREGKNTSTVS